MGAGNPKLKSFDNDRFEPTTYFLDLVGDIDEYKKNTDDASELADDVIDEMMNEDAEFNFEDLIESLSSELNLSTVYRGDNLICHSELSYAFRADGIILNEGMRSYVITESDSEYSHLPIAVIPNFKYETIVDDTEYEMEGRQAWYSARNKSWNDAVTKKADMRWNRLMKEFYKESKIILYTLYKWYPKAMRTRNGAWMSEPVHSEQHIAA